MGLSRPFPSHFAGREQGSERVARQGGEGIYQYKQLTIKYINGRGGGREGARRACAVKEPLNELLGSLPA